MRRVLLTLALLFVAVGAIQASAGTISRGTIPSSALGRDFPYLVYLPDDYEPGGVARYPVLYLLHGASVDETAWTERGNIQEHADRLIRDGRMPPTIIVMPGCVGCWWIDGAKDKAETAFWNDFVPAIESRYRTLGSAHGRILAGFSAGGYGAVRFGLKYPDKVAGVAALSPAIYAVTPPAKSSARRDPPFLRPDGQFNQSLWSAENYPRLAQRYFEQPIRVPFYLLSGNSDEFGIGYEVMQLYRMLSEGQPEQVQMNIVDGHHDWACWAANLDAALIFLSHQVPRHHASVKVGEQGSLTGTLSP